MAHDRRLSSFRQNSTRSARVFTESVIEQITRRARDGAGAAEIARELGLKVNSLRVTCSHLGVSLRKLRDKRQANPRSSAVHLTIVVSRTVMRDLDHLSATKGMTPEALATRLLAVASEDGLWSALLDE